MFKCKRCGRQFGANTPEACPGCGGAVRQPEPSGYKLAGLFLFGGAVELGCVVLPLAVILAIGIVLAFKLA